MIRLLALFVLFGCMTLVGMMIRPTGPDSLR